MCVVLFFPLLLPMLPSGQLSPIKIEVQKRLTLGPKKEPVFSLCQSPQGRYLAFGGEKGQVVVWDLENDEKWCEFNQSVGASVQAVAFAPDEKILFFGCVNGTLGAWDIAK